MVENGSIEIKNDKKNEDEKGIERNNKSKQANQNPSRPSFGFPTLTSLQFIHPHASTGDLASMTERMQRKLVDCVVEIACRGGGGGTESRGRNTDDGR